jgi:hypothetical protein
MHHRFLAEGLEVLGEKTGDILSYQTLLASCVYGSSTLFIIRDTLLSIDAGFFCVSLYVDMCGVEAHLSAAFFIKGYDHLGLVAGLQKAEEFGIIVKADMVTFSSPRLGWLKVAPKLGFRLESQLNGNLNFIKGLHYDS